MVCCIFLSQFPPYRQPISLILRKTTLVFFWIGVFLITFLYCILMKLYFVSFFMYPLVKKKKKSDIFRLCSWTESVSSQLSFQGSVHKPLSPPVNQFTPEETPDKRHQQTSISLSPSMQFYISSTGLQVALVTQVVIVSESEAKVNVPETCKRYLSGRRAVKKNTGRTRLQHKTSEGKQRSRKKARSDPSPNAPFHPTTEYPPPHAHDF